MAKLTSRMKEMFDFSKGFRYSIVATSDNTGLPNLGPKGSIFVLGDETLVYSESTARKTLRNLEQNPKVSVMVLDLDKREGYQFKGKAEFIKDGPLFERCKERQLKRGFQPPQVVVRIKVEEIYSYL